MIIALDQGLFLSFFVFLLSALAAASFARAETRYSVPASRLLYFMGYCLIAALVFGRLTRPGGWPASVIMDRILYVLLLSGLVYLMFEARRGIKQAPFLASVLSLCLCTAAIITRASFDAGPAGESITRLAAARFHAYFFIVSFAAFSASFVLSAAFLYQDRMIRKKLAGKLIRFIPSLEMVSRLNFASLTVGAAGFLAGTVIGFVHAGGLARRVAPPGDPLVLASIVILTAYGGMLMIHVGRFQRGRHYARLSIAVYLCSTAVLFVMSRLGGGFH